MANKHIEGADNHATPHTPAAKSKAPKKAVTQPAYKDIIPKKFFRDEHHPQAETVGELIAVLQQLPAELYIGPESQGGVHVIVYNISLHDIHVGIEEGDGL